MYRPGQDDPRTGASIPVPRFLCSANHRLGRPETVGSGPTRTRNVSLPSLASFEPARERSTGRSWLLLSFVSPAEKRSLARACSAYEEKPKEGGIPSS